MTYGAGLTALLILLWLTLSGHYTLDGDNYLLIGFGVASVVVTVVLAARMRILDRETVPVMPAFSLMLYWIWLGREIAAANIAVVRLVMRPQIDIEPRLVRVAARQRSALGHTVFANSITLTPGTVTIDVGDDAFLVHALDTSFTDQDGFAEMGSRSDSATDGKRETE